KVAKARHHPAMPYAELPGFMRELLAVDGLSRRALAWTILTAARTDETVGMPWSEIHGRVWTVPKERMKAGEEHTVPLTDAALGLLRGLPRDKPPFPLSNGAMLALLKKHMGRPFTVHGF